MKQEDYSLKDAIDSITLHGLPRALTSKYKSIRVFWLAAFLVSLGTLIIYTIENVKVYYQYQVLMKTQSQPEKPMPFPAVTICNSNRFNSVNSQPFREFPMQNMVCNRTANLSALTTEEIEFQKGCKMFLASSNDTFRFGGKESAGFPAEFKSTTSIYPCFSFNQNGSRSQSIAGSNKGLEMIFYSDPEDYLDFNINDLSRFDDFRRGLIVTIHDPSTDAPMDPFFSIAIPTGQSIDIGLRRVIKRRKPAPYASNCHDRHQQKYETIPGRYTVASCFMSCFHMKMKKKCGPENQSQKQRECQVDFYKEYPIEDCDCPHPCEEITYDTNIIRTTWPKGLHLQVLSKGFTEVFNATKQQMTAGFFQERLVQLRIYYSDLVADVVSEEEMYGVSKLMSEFGGLMGLFIGASLLSIVEIFWLVTLSIKKMFFMKHRTKPTMVMDKNLDLEQ